MPLSSGKSEKRAREGQGAARWRRIQKLSKKLSEQLTDDTRAIWLELEEALNAHWLDVATDQYRRGVEVGSAGSVLLTASGDDAPPAVRLQALVVVLSAIADALEDA